MDEYFLEIEAHFAARRGTPFILSAKDWALMRKWADDGIPLPVVIEAIDSVFEKNETSGRRKIISSLSYCRHAIKELWDARRDLYVGSSDVPPEAAPEARLTELAEKLPEPFASRVRELARERSVPRIEQSLMDIEREMIESLVNDEIRNELAAIDTSKLDSKIRARTEEANLRRIVRERFGLPRLTLF
ncbi:MAG TPA: hypothetical protein VJ853_07390 [Thermoanaerobaculia bacterium]|nr:hypothetical protein [Thermoanaerobaculia bacterium]